MANLELLLHDYKGYTFKQKVIDDCNKILLEEKAKVFGYLPRPSEVSLVTVLDKNKNEILDIGGSKPNDLILNNFGKLYHQAHGTPGVTVVLQDIGDVGNALRASGGNRYTQVVTFAGGTQIQVGSGSTPPDRTDFNVETAFASAPENGRGSTGAGGYNSSLAQVQVARSIGATGGSGTINESCLFGVWVNTANVTKIIMIARDAISGVGFVAANFINVTYTWQL